MRAEGIVLATNVNSSADQSAVGWQGGRGALVITASAYGTTVSFQLLGPDGATWITLNGSTIGTNSATAYDVPAGQVRLHITGGTTTALYCNFVPTPYA
jgi:hypothetical protein